MIFNGLLESSNASVADEIVDTPYNSEIAEVILGYFSQTKDDFIL
jgi:hypothetical protein